MSGSTTRSRTFTEAAGEHGPVPEAATVADIAILAAEPKPLGFVVNDDAHGGESEFERFHSVIVPAGAAHQVIDVEKLLDEHRPTPRRKVGAYAVHDAASFGAYVAKHGDADTEVWADALRNTITAVLNANRGDGPRWQDHRVQFAAVATDAWKAWSELDGKFVDQTRFAEHLEDRAVDIVQPSSATLVELAQSFQATTSVSFQSSKRLSSGERQLEYREETEARAGRAGQLTIPEKFVIGIRPFEGSDAFRVTARLRYRILDGNLRLGFRLERPEDVVRDAFLTVVAAINEHLTPLEHSTPILLGAPPTR